METAIIIISSLLTNEFMNLVNSVLHMFVVFVVTLLCVCRAITSVLGLTVKSSGPGSTQFLGEVWQQHVVKGTSRESLSVHHIV